jgi:hypothetical protein
MTSIRHWALAIRHFSRLAYAVVLILLGFVRIGKALGTRSHVRRQYRNHSEPGIWNSEFGTWNLESWRAAASFLGVGLLALANRPRKPISGSNNANIPHALN